MSKQEYIYEVYYYPYNEYGLYTNLEDARVAVEERCEKNTWISSAGCYDKAEEITISRRIMGWETEEVELVKYIRELENGIIKTTRKIMECIDDE